MNKLGTIITTAILSIAGIGCIVAVYLSLDDGLWAFAGWSLATIICFCYILKLTEQMVRKTTWTDIREMHREIKRLENELGEEAYKYGDEAFYELVKTRFRL